MGNNKANRSGFYIVIVCMFFISVSLLIYTEGQAALDDEIDEAYSEFITIEIPVMPSGTHAFMRSLFSGTHMVYAAEQMAEQINDNIPPEMPYALELEALLPPDGSFFYGSIILNTLDDGTALPNDITISDLELPDDDLLLSERTNSWMEHVVQQGETLSDIAMKFSGVTVQDVARANELKNPNQLSEKQILLVPLKEEFIENTLEEVRTRKARVAALKEAIVPLEVKNYTIQEGDSLWSIANSMNLEVDTLIGSNTLGNVLRPNVVLRIPNQDGIFYKIKAGDTVQKISTAYKVQVERIKNVNPTLDLNSLKAGEELFIPGARIEAAEPKTADNRNNNRNNNRTSSRQSSGSGSNVNRSSSRDFIWPVAGKISSPFGWRRHPITRRNDFHSAIDIRAPRGTPIRASRGGKVVHSGWMGAYGNTVVIEHTGGYSTLYSHCSSLNVNKGQNVSSGQVIARVGATGRATGPHLHFEIRSRNKPINPLGYLK